MIKLTDPVLMTLIITIPTLINAIGGLKIQRKLEDVRVNVDGRLTELLNLTEKSALAQGNLEGRAQLSSEADTSKEPKKSTEGV